MLKITALLTFLLIGMLWAANLNCDSCGRECTSACGTRRFRSCCFNYLRRKRVPEGLEFWSPTQEGKVENLSKLKPVFIVENISEQWMSNSIPNDYTLYPVEDTLENAGI